MSLRRRAAPPRPGEVDRLRQVLRAGLVVSGQAPSLAAGLRSAMGRLQQDEEPDAALEYEACAWFEDNIGVSLRPYENMPNMGIDVWEKAQAYLLQRGAIDVRTLDVAPVLGVSLSSMFELAFTEALTLYETGRAAPLDGRTPWVVDRRKLRQAKELQDWELDMRRNPDVMRGIVRTKAPVALAGDDAADQVAWHVLWFLVWMAERVRTDLEPWDLFYPRTDAASVRDTRAALNRLTPDDWWKARGAAAAGWQPPAGLVLDIGVYVGDEWFAEFTHAVRYALIVVVDEELTSQDARAEQRRANMMQRSPSRFEQTPPGERTRRRRRRGAAETDPAYDSPRSGDEDDLHY